MANAYPQSRQCLEASATGAERSWHGGHDPDHRRRTLARSLESALENVASLHLYARSIVRMLETCEAEANLPRPRRRRSGPARVRRQPMDLEFVREDVDRLAGEVQAQLALLRAGLQSSGLLTTDCGEARRFFPSSTPDDGRDRPCPC